MRIMLIAPMAAFALASTLFLSFLLLLGMPGVLATIITLAVMGVSSHQLGWRPTAWATLSLAGLFVVMAVFFLAMGYPVFAQSSSVAPSVDTVVSIPWGDWLASLLGDAAAVLSVVILGVITRFLPATLRAYLTAQRTAQVEQLLERALGFAAQKIGAMVKGKVADIDVHNELVENALQYAIDHGPEKLVKWMGGADAIEQKIIARIPTSASVAAVTLSPAAAAP